MSNNFNTENWKYFYLKDLFYINKGKRLTKEDSVDGDIPFITAGEENLGVSRYVENEVEQFSDSITIDMFGFSFYRDFIFACDDNIIVLKLKENASKYIYNFISTIINCDKYRMSYGRQYRLKILENHKIKLPSKLNEKNEYEPDWEYMESYTRKLYEKVIRESYTRNTKACLKFNINEWKSYRLDKIFKFEKGKCNNAGQLLENGDELYYIGAKKSDNGVMYKVKNVENLKSDGNCLIFISDGEGSVGFHLYQDLDFIGSTTLKIARNKKLNKYNALFLVSVLDKERFRYSFGRKYKINEYTKIKLPSKLNLKNEYEPDWEYMENYIKQLPYGDII